MIHSSGFANRNAQYGKEPAQAEDASDTPEVEVVNSVADRIPAEQQKSRKQIQPFNFSHHLQERCSIAIREYREMVRSAIIGWIFRSL